MTDLASAQAANMQLMLEVMATTSRDEQGCLAESMKGVYGYKEERRGWGEYVWNSLSGDWIDRDSVAATHVFPRSLGQGMMDYIFGRNARGEVNSPLNGLWLPVEIASQFNQYRIVIVPGRPFARDMRQDRPRTWKMLVLDQALFNRIMPGSTNFRAIHDKEKIFRNDYQPRALYLYFHYQMAMVMTSRKSAENTVSVLDLADAWDEESSGLCENMIRSCVEVIHGLPEQMKEKMLRHANAGFADNEEDRMIKSLEGIELDSVENEDGGDCYDTGIDPWEGF